MAEVRRVRLGDVAYEYKERIGEETPNRPVYGVDKNVGLTAEPRYQASNLSRYKRIEHGMFAYNPMRLNIGSIGFCHDDLSPGIVSPDYVVFGCRDDALLPKFMDYHTRSAPWADWLSLAGEGSVRERIYFRKLETYELKLPDASYQKAAIEILSALDGKIKLNRQMNEALETLAQAIFQDWFVEFGPVRRKQEGAADPVAVLGGLIADAAKAASIATLFPDGFAGDELPVGWESSALDVVCTVNDESWKNSDHPAEIDYVDLANTKWGVIESVSRLSWKDAPSRARRITKAGDSIVGTVRPGNGSYAFISDEGYTVSTGFAVLRPRQLEYASFVYIAATRPDNIYRLANLADGHGGTYPAVNPGEVTRTEIAFAGKPVLQAFNELAAPLRARIEHNKKENRSLAETRDYLLPMLMSGEVCVRDAQQAVPG